MIYHFCEVWISVLTLNMSCKFEFGRNNGIAPIARRDHPPTLAADYINHSARPRCINTKIPRSLIHMRCTLLCFKTDEWVLILIRTTEETQNIGRQLDELKRKKKFWEKTPFAAPKTFEWAKQSEAHNTVAAIVLFLSNIIIIESALEQLLDQL